MSFRVYLSIAVVAGMTSLGPSSLRAQEASRPGIVQQRPESEPFVRIESGFMVPYQQRIPGTDITFEMVPIAGGRFRMGSPRSESARHADEGPQVSIVVEPFWMGRHEVTWKEFRIFMGLKEASRELFRNSRRSVTNDHGVDAVTAPSVIYDTCFAYEGGEGPDTPAVTMTHYAAKQYTKWLSLLLEDFYRLPSEAEWEYACRAGTTTAYSFGDDKARLADHAWFNENSREQRHVVGSKLPNPWGLHDMHGNVAEWVLDAYSADGYASIGEGTVTSGEAIRWPTEVYPRVARGGSWELSAGECRSAARLASSEVWSEEDPELPNSPWWHTSFASTGVGFRLIRPLSAPESATQKERFWGAENNEFQTIVDQRIEEGKGVRGLLHPDQPSVILPRVDQGR